MGTYNDEMEQARKDFISSFQEQFKNYLAEHQQAFSFYELQEFSKNVIYIDYAHDPKDQANIKAFLKTYESQIATEYNGDKAQAKEALKKLFRRFPNTHVKPWDSYIDSVVNFDDSKDYKSGIFERRFPTGTISYIGARPGRGKTTILVNIALDALNQGKPVVYVTAEETTKQILTRFILADTCTKHETDGRTVYESFKPRPFLYNYLKDASKTLPGIEINNGDFYGDSVEAIKSYIDSKKLTIFEAYGATWDELTDFLNTQEAGSVILIDYIQHLKSPERLITQTRQIQIQEISHQLADLAGLHGLILICGAQFTRPKTDAQKTDIEAELKKPDSFNENSFREAGDIEQDGHILIGIGKNPGTEELFYTCMKDREQSPDNGKCWKLKKNMAYSFLQGDRDDQGNKIEYHPPKPPKKPSKEEGQDTGKQSQEAKTEALKNFKYGGNK